MLDDCAIDAAVVTPPDGHDLSSWAATDTDWFAALTASATPRPLAVAGPPDQCRLDGGFGIEMSLSVPGPH
jgi:hypothetical protein